MAYLDPQDTSPLVGSMAFHLTLQINNINIKILIRCPFSLSNISGSNAFVCILVGTILNKHAHNFAEFFNAQNGSDFDGYARIQDQVQTLGQPFKTNITSVTSIPESHTEKKTLDDNGEDLNYPLVPVLATLTLLVGNTISRN